MVQHGTADSSSHYDTKNVAYSECNTVQQLLYSTFVHRRGVHDSGNTPAAPVGLWVSAFASRLVLASPLLPYCTAYN